MSLRLLRQNQPRSFALVTDAHALILRCKATSSTSDPSQQKHEHSQKSPTCTVDFVTLQDVDLTSYHEAHSSGLHGTLGLIDVGQDVFLCVISASHRAAVLRPGETVERITGVEFCEQSLPI